jgi:Fe2+ or Zn2+ uptake regulation protein
MVESQGLKMTPQRRAIVEYLQFATHHPTAEEVLNAVNERFPMTSRATVYNTLNWLKDAGLVKEVYEGSIVRFDPNTSHHHHFICRSCGKVEDIESEFSDAFQLGLRAGDRKVENVEVILRGLCPHCRLK